MGLDIEPLRGGMARHLQEFLDDEKILADEPFFEPHHASANAKALLNERLDWVAPPSERQTRQITATTTAIHFPQSIRPRLKRWGPDFPRFHSFINYAQFDLGWMAELLQYDYWDLLEGSPIDPFTRAQLLSLYLTQTNVPDFEDFVLFSKLRLMKGIYEGKLDIAVHETRHLAQILYSTETFMGAMTAIAILRAEGQVAEYLSSDVPIQVTDFRPVSRKTLDRARRAILGFNALFTVFTPRQVLESAFYNPKLHVGLCSGLAKGMLRSLLVRRLLEPKIDLERSFSTSFVALDKAVEANRDFCRISLLKKLWDQKDSRTPWMALYGEGSWDWLHIRWIQHVPFFRRAWGIDLASLYLSNGLTSYSSH